MESLLSQMICLINIHPPLPMAAPAMNILYHGAMKEAGALRVVISMRVAL